MCFFGKEYADVLVNDVSLFFANVVALVKTLCFKEMTNSLPR
jgi:hypothetical protein